MIRHELETLHQAAIAAVPCIGQAALVTETFMTMTEPFAAPSIRAGARSLWLTRYYAARALFSVIWVALAFTIGRANPIAGIGLLIVYPAWDSVANFVDAARNGGLRANPTQMLNAIVSAIVTLAVAVTIFRDFHIALGVIGLWAALSGLLQLATGVRRWREASAQWPQILSGAQSCLAAVHFVVKATNPAQIVSVADVAPYAAFGALYFAISAGVLAFKR